MAAERGTSVSGLVARELEQLVARARLEALWHSRTGALSTQVLTGALRRPRKLAAPMGRATARKIVALYAEWPVAQVDVPLILFAH